MHHHRAGSRAVKSGEQVQQRRFPRSRLTQQGDKLARLNRERDAVNRAYQALAHGIVARDVLRAHRGDAVWKLVTNSSVLSLDAAKLICGATQRPSHCYIRKGEHVCSPSLVTICKRALQRTSARPPIPPHCRRRDRARRFPCARRGESSRTAAWSGCARRWRRWDVPAPPLRRSR